MRQLTGAISGLRGGFEEFVFFVGTTGGNSKGTTCQLLEKLLGTNTGSTDCGMCSILTKAALLGRRQGEGPSEVEANMNGARIVTCDDFATTANEKVPNDILRSYAGGNNISAARKNKGNKDFATDFLMLLMVNKFPEFAEPLEEPDLRRLVPVDFRLAYKDADGYDASNPNHRHKKASIKTSIEQFFPEFVHWMRCLASTVKLGEEGTLQPRTQKISAALDAFVQQTSSSLLAKILKEFIAENTMEVDRNTSQRQGDLPCEGHALELKFIAFANVKLDAVSQPHITKAEGETYLRQALVYTAGSTRRPIKVAGKTLMSYYRTAADASRPFRDALQLKV